MPSSAIVADYCKKSGDNDISSGNIEENSHGFCVWRDDGDTFVMINVYGDGNYWNKWAETKARSLGITKLFFATKRSPHGFVRNHGFKIIGYILQREI